MLYIRETHQVLKTISCFVPECFLHQVVFNYKLLSDISLKALIQNWENSVWIMSSSPAMYVLRFVKCL